MKKKITVAVLLCVFIIAGIIGWNEMNGYSRALKANWNISLPAMAFCTEVYERDSGSSFHGDGIRYHVFSYKNEDYIDSMCVWSADEKETLFYASFSEAVSVWLDKIDVPEEQRPDYSDCLFQYQSREDNSEIIILLDNEANRFYVIESFI